MSFKRTSDATMPLLTKGGLPRAALIATVLVVAANLRAPIAMVGPVIDQIGADTGSSPATLGLLGSLPLISFALVSPAVSAMAKRWGMERTILGALFLLALGSGLRSLPGLLNGLPQVSLILGTVLLSMAIGIGNVLTPAIVRRDFPDHVAQITGWYTAAMSGAAALASAAVVPLSGWLTWELALSTAAVFAVCSAGIWALRLRRTRSSHEANVGAARVHGTRQEQPTKENSVSMWTSPLAWQVMLYFGLQSSLYYFIVTWFPAIQTSVGVDPTTAGGWLAVFLATGIVGSLTVGQIMQRSQDYRIVACGLGVLIAAGLVGIVIAPGLMPVWALVLGFAAGASFLAGMALIALHGSTPELAGRLSGMAQSGGYLLAAGGPIMAGLLYQTTTSWPVVLLVIASAALFQGFLGLFVGRRQSALPA